MHRAQSQRHRLAGGGHQELRHDRQHCPRRGLAPVSLQAKGTRRQIQSLREVPGSHARKARPGLAGPEPPAEGICTARPAPDLHGAIPGHNAHRMVGGLLRHTGGLQGLHRPGVDGSHHSKVPTLHPQRPQNSRRRSLFRLRGGFRGPGRKEGEKSHRLDLYAVPGRSARHVEVPRSLAYRRRTTGTDRPATGARRRRLCRQGRRGRRFLLRGSRGPADRQVDRTLFAIRPGPRAGRMHLEVRGAALLQPGRLQPRGLRVQPTDQAAGGGIFVGDFWDLRNAHGGQHSHPLGGIQPGHQLVRAEQNGRMVGSRLPQVPAAPGLGVAVRNVHIETEGTRLRNEVHGLLA
mmetsp:Transcript_7304/g.21170  ORF Transcript_7304/g.21170 Transcript_7304/m.21170 type:complete len:348 (-) Transcript_7304:1906-2949(-)